MKIHLTIDDLTAIVRKSFGISDGVRLTVIVDPTSPIVSKIHAALGSLPESPANKIPRIKALREACHDFPFKGFVMPLHIAKEGIERFESFMAYIVRTGELPTEVSQF